MNVVSTTLFRRSFSSIKVGGASKILVKVGDKLVKVGGR